MYLFYSDTIFFFMYNRFISFYYTSFSLQLFLNPPSFLNIIFLYFLVMCRLTIFTFSKDIFSSHTLYFNHTPPLTNTIFCKLIILRHFNLKFPSILTLKFAGSIRVRECSCIWLFPLKTASILHSHMLSLYCHISMFSLSKVHHFILCSLVNLI